MYRPTLPSTAPPPRRFPVWVVGSAVVTLTLMVGAMFVSVLTRYDPSEHNDEFSFLARDLAGDPVRWNPCEPIRYTMNVALAPPGSIEDVREAIRRVSQATGIVFVSVGLTDEMPARRRPAYQPLRYGGEWAPILVAWVDPDDSDLSFRSEGHTAAGIAAPVTPQDGSEVIVSGWVAINADDPNPPGFSSIDAQGPVVLHELGHVMGLDHVEESGELMHDTGGGVTDFGPGDLEGLRRLGRTAGCLTTPPTPGYG